MLRRSFISLLSLLPVGMFKPSSAQQEDGYWLTFKNDKFFIVNNIVRIHVVGNLFHYYNAKEQLHREDGPAIVGPNFEAYYINGKLHREDGPAKKWKEQDGLSGEEWHRNGELHRIGGPALMLNYNDRPIIVEYRENGQLHRENGPASVRLGFEVALRIEYWKNGLKHKADGPAELCPDHHGSYMHVFKWWEDGKIVKYRFLNKQINLNPPIDESNAIHMIENYKDYCNA